MSSVNFSDHFSLLLPRFQRQALVIVSACVLLSVLIPSRLIASEAEDLLNRMTQTVRSLNYEGDFVYQTGEVMNAMHIVHSVQDGYEKEHLKTLTGPDREIIRDDYTLTRYAPDDQQLSVTERRRAHARTLASFDIARLESLYRIELLGSDRVAGRETKLIAVMPKDQYRYGHRLYLDTETALPLRRIVVDHQGARISQMMFTTIDISAMDKPQDVQPEQVAPFEYTGEWAFKDLPNGFVMELHDKRDLGGALRDHFLFSDGITRLSLYIENSSSGDGTRQTSVGGVGILSTRVDGRKVTVVGEAPIETLKVFLRSVTRREADATGQ